MKKYLLILSFFAVFANAQIHRFVYEYKYIPNINQKDTIRKDMMALDIDGKGSVYQSLTKIKSDSTMKAQIAKAMATGGGNFNFRSSQRPGSINYKVIKEYPEFKTYLVDRISTDMYKVLEEEKQDWKILPETQKIGAYKAQKATTTWGGRSWTAWFSSELPFQDGPYKFSGLPGLIVKIEDSTGSHILTLVANKKIDAAKEEELKMAGNIRMIGLGGKEIPVNEYQFSKAWKNYISDPAKNMRQMMSGNSSGSGQTVVFKMRTQDGKEVSDMNEMAKMLEKSVKDDLKNNNNKIEPSLYEIK